MPGGSISLGDVLRHGCDQGDPVFSSRNGIFSGSIDDRAPKLSGCLQIHIVYTHTRSFDNLEPPARASQSEIFVQRSPCDKS